MRSSHVGNRHSGAIGLFDQTDLLFDRPSAATLGTGQNLDSRAFVIVVIIGVRLCLQAMLRVRSKRGCSTDLHRYYGLG
jgi:hypothetical protein